MGQGGRPAVVYCAYEYSVHSYHLSQSAPVKGNRGSLKTLASNPTFT